jgi:nitroreductase
MSIALPLERLESACLEQILAAAGLAPSLHKTQPWRYRLHPDTTTLDILAVPQRALRAIDPTGRTLHLSVGAAVFNLRVAARHLGWEPMVRLLPTSSDPHVLARIRLAEARQSSSGSWPDLLDAIGHRHSSRQPFSDRPVPTAVLSELVEAAQVEGARLSTADPKEARRMLALTAEAERRTVADPLRREESRRWTDRHAGTPTGGPAAAFVPLVRLPPTDPATGAPFEAQPLVLATAEDRRVDWLRAGQAMQHVLLLATTHQLRSSLLHQAMQWPDLRRSLSGPHHRLGHVQMLIQLGYEPERAVGGAAPEPHRTVSPG